MIAARRSGHSSGRAWSRIPPTPSMGLAVDPRPDDGRWRGCSRSRGRDSEVAVPLIAAEIEQACAAGHFGAARDGAWRSTFWPGPLSIVVPARPALSRAALARTRPRWRSAYRRTRWRGRWRLRSASASRRRAPIASGEPPAESRGRRRGSACLTSTCCSMRGRAPGGAAVDDRRASTSGVAACSCAPGRSRGTA